MSSTVDPDTATTAWLMQIAEQAEMVAIGDEIFITPADYQRYIKSGRCINYFDRQTAADYGLVGYLFARKIIVQTPN